MAAIRMLRNLVTGICLVSTTLLADIHPPTLILPRTVDAGEQLLSALACADCHQASPGAQVRLMPRTGPRLGADGPRLTSQFLRQWLQNPQAIKPGTTMPDSLHGLTVVDRAEAIEDLTHFLMAAQGVDTNSAVAADPFKIAQGRKLYHEVGCVACHAPVDDRDGVSASEAARLRQTSIPLGDLSRKMSVSALTQFLRDPLKSRPNGRMPSFNLTARDAEAIAMYLLRGQAIGLEDPSKAQKFPGVRYQYFEANLRDEADFDKVLPTISGVFDDFRLKPRSREDEVGYRFTGMIRVTEPGEYTFYTRSDDGSRLRIGAQLVVDNWGEHGMEEKSGSLVLAAGDHAFQLTWYNGGGESSLEVLWQGPGIAKQRLPKSALFQMSVPMEPLGGENFTLDATRTSRGRERFAAVGCASCHEVRDSAGLVASRRTGKPLNDLKGQVDQGCLATSVKAGLPKYALSPEQRLALQETLRRVEELSQPLEPAQQIDHTLARLNCLACHSRDSMGGPEITGKSPWFAVVGDADLGDEGRIPPHLTRVGGKLNSSWLTNVLQRGVKTRPYMATRMPVFGNANVGALPALFEKVDATQPAPVDPTFANRDVKAGWKLVGSDGLSCIACHTFGKHKSLGIPAMDLTQMHQRLRSDWFQKYLVDPAALRPGTRMPTFWPEGRAVNRDILNGETTAQIQAIWAFLSRGAKADVPAGLIRASKEIVVAKEPVIYRNFIEGAGSRAIGVGYPERAHLAFDANDLRLAVIWQGSFIDMARHSTDRGVGFEPPLGDHVYKFPAGPAFASLNLPDAAWPSESAKAAGWKFLGYSLDAKRRPMFRYRLGDLLIEDFPEPKAAEFEVSLQRTITLRGSHSGRLYFRAAVGEIKARPDGGWLIDGDVKLSIRGGGTPELVGKELRVPVLFRDNQAVLVEEFVW